MREREKREERKEIREREERKEIKEREKGKKFTGQRGPWSAYSPRFKRERERDKGIDTK